MTSIALYSLLNLQVPLSVKFRGFSFETHSKYSSNKKKQYRGMITGNLFCQPCHIQPLINLGVKFRFSEGNRVGAAWNQKTFGSGGNSCSFNVFFDLDTYRKIELFFRVEDCLDLHNNHHLGLVSFPFSPRFMYKQKLYHEYSLHDFKIQAIRFRARKLKMMKKLPQQGYGFN